MLSDKLIMLSDDDSRHDALAEIFETRCPPIALESYVGVLKANGAVDGQRAAKYERISSLQAKRRDWLSHVHIVQRDIDRGYDVHPSEMKKYESNKKKIAGADKEIASLRTETHCPNLPADTLGDFLLESSGKFVAAAVKVNLPKAQTALEALATTRANREVLVRKRAETNKEPLPLEAAVARLVADVDAKAQAPDFHPTTKMKAQIRSFAMSTNVRPDAQGHVEWPTMEEVVEGGRRVEMDQGNAFVCWLLRDLLIERGTAELKKLYAGKKGLSVEDRTRIIAEIDAEILKEERREETIIRMCEDANLTVYRRPLANPLAVLGIAPA